MFQCIAGLVSEHRSAVNVLTGFTHWITLQKCTLMLRFHHFDLDQAGRRQS